MINLRSLYIGFVRAKSDPTLIPEIPENIEKNEKIMKNEKLIKKPEIFKKDESDDDEQTKTVFKKYKQDRSRVSEDNTEDNTLNGALKIIKESPVQYLNIMPVWQA